MIKEYLNYIKQVRGLAPHTCECYANDLGAFVAYAREKQLRWSTLTEQDVDSWLMSMASAGLSGKTRNRKLAALRGLLTWAQHKGLLEHNAARFCQSSKTSEHLPQTVSIEGIDQYLQQRRPSTRGAIVALMVSLMVEGGLRISEAMSITTESINTDERSITLTGKGNKQRKVFYGERTAKELETWLPALNGALLPNWSARTFRGMIEAELQPYVGKTYPHALRHTYATAMLNAGMPITTLSMLMGHKSVETTQIYAKVATASAKRQYEQYKI